MEFDPAIVLFGAVVLVLVAILIGVLYAARDRRTQVSEEWVQDLDKLDARLEAIAVEVALLAAQIRHLEGVEGLQREVTYLREENKRLQEEWRKLLGEVARITELLGRQPP
jgi:peptidoglycan hydrolase CwlO-like protein